MWLTPMQILAKGLGMIAPDDGRPPVMVDIAHQPTDSSEAVGFTKTNDENEEQEAPDEGSRTHKRVLSSSETDSPAQSKALSKKRARLSSGMPGAPLVNPASVPSAPSTSLSTIPSTEPSNEPSTLIPQTGNPQPPLASAQEDGPDAGRTPVPSGKACVERHQTGEHHVTDNASEPEKRMHSSSEHSETQNPLGSGNQDQALENAQEATPHSEYEDSDDPEIYGEPKRGKGKFATRFYPDRSEAFKVPGGTISEHRKRIRYKGKSIEEIQRICDADRKSQEALLKYARGQIKGIKRAYFDPEVHCWLAPRIHNLSLLDDHSAEKTTLQRAIIRELFERFPDLHPNNLYLQNTEMEDTYIAKIKSSLTSHTSNLKKKANNSSHTPARFGPVLFRSMRKIVSTRPADLWFWEPNVKACLYDWWKEEDKKVAKKCTPEDVRRTRLARYMEWRKKVFARLPDDVQEHYKQLAQDAKNEPEKMDPEDLALHGIPFIQSWLHEFSVQTGIPFMLVLSSPNPENPSQIDTYCQTGRGNTPSDILDFKNMDSDWVMKSFIPRWRKFAEKAFAGHDAEAADLTFEVIESALVDAQVEEPILEGPNQVQGFDNLEEILSMTKMREVVSGRIKESWFCGYGSSRVDYAKAGRSEYLDPERRPRIRETIQMEVLGDDGSTVLKEFTSTVVVPLINPNNMGFRELQAWFRHVTDPKVQSENRLAFRGELAKLQAKVRTIPATIQKALVLSDDSMGDVSETETSDEEVKTKTKPRTKSAASRGKKRAIAKPKVAKPSSDDEPEAAEGPTSAEDDCPPLDESDNDPTTSEGDHDSDGIPQNRAAKGTKTRSNRVSIPPTREPPAATSEEKKSSSKPQRPTPAQSSLAPAKTKQSKPSMAHADSEAQIQPTSFTFRGSVVGEDCPQDKFMVPSLERRLLGIKELPEPNVLAHCPPDCRSVQTLFSSLLHIDLIFPNLPVLDMTLLPHGFSKHVGSEQYQESMARFFDFINDIDVPIPKMLELFQNCSNDTELLKPVFDIMSSFIDCALDKLSSTPMPIRTSNIVGIIARYLDFLRRAENQFKEVRPSPEAINVWLDRLALAGWRSLVLTYCMSTARGFLDVSCGTAPLTTPPTIDLGNAVEVLMNWWYLSLRKIARDPPLELEMLDFLPKQWNPPLAKLPPCIRLSTFDERWYRASFTTALEKQVDHYLEISLHQNLSCFEGISLLDQMQALTSIFAVHKHKCQTTEAAEETWLPYLERLVQVIQISCADGDTADGELRKIGDSLVPELEAPPEKPPRRPAPRRKAQGTRSDSSTGHSWALGDVAEVMLNKRKLKIQVIEQDDRLHIINLTTRKIIKNRDGISYSPKDVKLVNIISTGTILDRTNPDLRRLPSFLPPKPVWHKPETYMYPVFLSDDEQAEAAAAAEANKPKPSVVDPELDIHRAVNVDAVIEWESQGTEGQDLGAGEGDVVVFNRDRAGQAADECGDLESCEEGVDVAHRAESRSLVEDTDGKPKRAKKGESAGGQSSARVTRSQPTPGSDTPGPSTKPGTRSKKSPKKTTSEGFKAKNPVAKKARIEPPQPETSGRKSSNAKPGAKTKPTKRITDNSTATTSTPRRTRRTAAKK